jgi:hypothetical protein
MSLQRGAGCGLGRLVGQHEAQRHMRRQRLREPEAERRVPGVVRQPDRRLRLELAAEAIALARGLAQRIVGLEGVFGQAAGQRGHAPRPAQAASEEPARQPARRKRRRAARAAASRPAGSKRLIIARELIGPRFASRSEHVCAARG